MPILGSVTTAVTIAVGEIRLVRISRGYGAVKGVDVQLGTTAAGDGVLGDERYAYYAGVGVARHVGENDEGVHIRGAALTLADVEDVNLWEGGGWFVLGNLLVA